MSNMPYSTNDINDRQLLGTPLWLLLAPAWKLSEWFNKLVHTTKEDR